jgi:UDP-glucose 4-epimerase
VLVTGGAGYVGSVTAAELMRRGHEVTVLDDLSTGHEDGAPKGARLVRGGIDAAAAVLIDADAVVHFAARSLVAESVRAPESYWATNVCGTRALLDAMRRAGVRRMVFSSSAAAYGEPEQIPITEDTPERPTNPYGATKLAVDHMLAGESGAHGLAAASLRYFNVAGADGPLGERHDPETHLIAILVEVVTGQRDHIDINGTDYPTPDGTCVRDYVHVRDLAEAHVLALDAAEPGRHRVYNLGGGAGYSVREVVEAVRRVTGHPVPERPGPRRPGDPARLVAGIERAREELGWTPKATLEQMVADAWEFAQARTAGPA